MLWAFSLFFISGQGSEVWVEGIQGLRFKGLGFKVFGFRGLAVEGLGCCCEVGAL